MTSDDYWGTGGGQPQQPAQSQPQQPAYGQPQQPAYGQPQQPAYGQQQQPVHGRSAFGQPAHQGWGETPAYAVEAPGAYGGAPQRNRGKIVTAGVAGAAALALVGGATVFAFDRLGGGGAQPEAAMPATTIAFAKVDLDPSSSQKVDAIRFLKKFPNTDSLREDMDLRKWFFEEASKNSDHKNDWSEVEQWLGDRAGAGLVPGTEGASPRYAVVLAVTDKEKAQAYLPKMTDSNGQSCEVGDEWMTCSDSSENLRAVVDATAAGTLADSETYQADLDELGEAGIASAWMDLTQVAEVAKSMPGSAGLVNPGLTKPGTTLPGGTTGGLPGAASNVALATTAGVSAAPASTEQELWNQMQGRLATTLRFDGPNLELVGKVKDLSETYSRNADAGTDIGRLPADTIGAVSANGLGSQLTKSWPEIEKQITSTTDALGSSGSASTDPLAAFEKQTGLKLPEDLAKALGERTTLAVASDGKQPKVALMTDGDRGVLQKVVDLTQKSQTPPKRTPSGPGITLQPRVAQPQIKLELTEGNDRAVVGYGKGYAQAVADGSGLADQEAFKAAVPNAGDADAVVYVDIEKAMELAGTTAGTAPVEGAVKYFDQLRALGVSSHQNGTEGDFTLRLTTK